MKAVYTHDYADREATLDAEVPGGSIQPIVTSASYYTAGPLSSLVLGNGLTETRLHDSRYHPDRITVTGASTLLDSDYTTDDVGNPTTIADVLNSANDRTYGYQDYQYFPYPGRRTLGNAGLDVRPDRKPPGSADAGTSAPARRPARALGRPRTEGGGRARSTDASRHASVCRLIWRREDAPSPARDRRGNSPGCRSSCVEEMGRSREAVGRRP